jgi:hypothetical protein
VKAIDSASLISIDAKTMICSDRCGFAVLIAQKCINGVYHGVKTSELDSLAAETAAYLTTEHPDYSILAARIAVSNLHKQTLKVARGFVTFADISLF